MNQLPKSVGAGNPHATFCGNRGRVTASGDPVGVETGATGDLVRHRHTKGAATDRVDLKPPASHSDSTNSEHSPIARLTAGQRREPTFVTRPQTYSGSRNQPTSRHAADHVGWMRFALRIHLAVPTCLPA